VKPPVHVVRALPPVDGDPLVFVGRGPEPTQAVRVAKQPLRPTQVRSPHEAPGILSSISSSDCLPIAATAAADTSAPLPVFFPFQAAHYGVHHAVAVQDEFETKF
jgi:hypothetical protein